MESISISEVPESALNYVDEQRKEKKHGLASDSPR